MKKSFLGQRIKVTRKCRDLTGEALAELCFINPTYLRQIEAGRKTPSLQVFIRICNVLEASPTYLLEDTLTKNELSEFASLALLWKQASPYHIALVTAMIDSVLEKIL